MSNPIKLTDTKRGEALALEMLQNKQNLPLSKISAETGIDIAELRQIRAKMHQIKIQRRSRRLGL